MAKKPSSPKHIGNVSICGFDFDVFHAKPGEMGLRDGVSGVCATQEQTIVINSDDNVQQQADTLLHEVCHGIWEHSGLKDWLAKEMRLGRNSGEMDKIEELWIRLFLPHFRVAAKDFGGVKLS